MYMSFRKFTAAASLLLALGLLGGCGSVSRHIAKDGQSAGTLVWPAPDSVNPMHKGGSVPNLDNLRQVKSGLDKQQIAGLIGYPHFNEGVWGVHEWNYLFNLRKPGSDDVAVCQYKVLFDEHMIARSFYWKPASCAELLKPAVVEAAPAAGQVFTLSTDALFVFDKSSLADIRPGGRAALDQLATKLQAADKKAERIRVTGYTDRLGSDAYNQVLSARRADTVRDYLVGKGVPADLVTAAGRGKSDPVVDCNEHRRAALIACLAPNRRVVVEVAGRK